MKTEDLKILRTLKDVARAIRAERTRRQKKTDAVFAKTLMLKKKEDALVYAGMPELQADFAEGLDEFQRFYRDIETDPQKVLVLQYGLINDQGFPGYGRITFTTPTTGWVSPLMYAGLMRYSQLAREARRVLKENPDIGTIEIA